MSSAAGQAKRAEGMAHLTFAVDCALTQHLAGRVFLLEHPAAVTSGQTRELQDLGSCAGVYSVAFNQCMTGPVSPCSRTPMRKRRSSCQTRSILSRPSEGTCVTRATCTSSSRALRVAAACLFVASATRPPWSTCSLRGQSGAWGASEAFPE